MKIMHGLFTNFFSSSEKKETGYLLYEHFPPFLYEGKRIYLAHYDISGIQSYIFSQINIHSTEAMVKSRSKYIENLTKEILLFLTNQFPEKVHELTWSSGNILCAFEETLKEERIREVSDRVQRAVFAATQGRLEVYYGIARAIATEGSLPDGALNASELCWVDLQNQKFHCINLLKTDFEKDKFKKFAPENTGIAVEGDESSAQKERKVYVALKFDFDNLGAFFHGLTRFDESKAASAALSEVVKECFHGIKHVRPIFTGGDDIFAITDIEHCYIVLSQMYKNVVHAVEYTPGLEKFRGDNFGLSGGCSFIHSSYGEVPLVFFMEESENALSVAKCIPGKKRVVFWDENLKREFPELDMTELSRLDEVYTWDQIHILAKVQGNTSWMKTMDERSQASTLLRLRAKILNDSRRGRQHILSDKERRILGGMRQ